jgi:NhaP-type Na+/H+ or K+/H+ antiporter
MSFLGWMALAGGVLLLMALSSAYLRNLPVSTSAVYLAIGAAIGPLGTGWLQIDLRAEVPWLERLTEVAVIVALFVGGLKLRLPLRDPAWIAAVRLAGPVMLASIFGVALCARVLLGLDPGAAILLGAVLAPTDPVLANTVKVDSAADRDRMRYGLSGEAGLNDGAAFPFVVFGLSWAEHGGTGPWIGEWALHRLVWAVLAGLLLGFALGRAVGWLAIKLRSRQKDTGAPSDFLALALIALAYVGAETVGAWGFLATFAAGVGLRHAELHVTRERPHPDLAETATEDLAAHPPP